MLTLDLETSRIPIVTCLGPFPAQGRSQHERARSIAHSRAGNLYTIGARLLADGFAVYEVLGRDGPGFALAHCWAHTKRKYQEIADHWPTACAEIGALIGELYAVERLVPGAFPGDTVAQTLPQQLRQERSRPILDRIWHRAAVHVGLPRSDFGKAVRYMLERWGPA